MPLTDVKVRSAKPEDKAYKLTAGEGMHLMVHPHGSKYWRLQYRYRFDGKKLFSIRWEKSALQRVHISQEALAKFQVYAAEGTASTWKRTAEGAAVAQPGSESEEEQAEREALIAADHEKMQVEFTRRLNEVWGNLSAVTDDYGP